MLLKLSHLRQQQHADCLAACAAMVLNYLQVSVSYARIRRLLGTTAEGTPFHHLERLRAIGVTVIRDKGSIRILAAFLNSNLPIIVDVHTGELPYWWTRTDISESEKATAHAVVVVGIEDQTIFIHDPDVDQAP
jgi:ABC-type bacteriocin/lantibiotic exporter with double-glycine peptidase domain